MQQFSDEASMVVKFFGSILKDPEVRLCYLKDPLPTAAKFGLSDNPSIVSEDGIFMRFVSDNTLWSALVMGDIEKVNEAIRERWTDLARFDSNKPQLIINNIHIINDALVASQQYAVALSTIKAVIVASGVK